MFKTNITTNHSIHAFNFMPSKAELLIPALAALAESFRNESPNEQVFLFRMGELELKMSIDPNPNNFYWEVFDQNNNNLADNGGVGGEAWADKSLVKAFEAEFQK